MSYGGASSVRLISSFNLPPSVIQKLDAAKPTPFRVPADLDGIGPVDLAREAGLTHKEALEVIKQVKLPRRPLAAFQMGESVLHNIAHGEQNRPVPTGSGQIDALLGGGVNRGNLTEFCGAPGVGKTQVGMQLSVNVQRPALLGGIDGSAVYIDTEGSFSALRAQDMARVLATECAETGAAPDGVEAYADGVLDRIHVYVGTLNFSMHALACLR